MYSLALPIPPHRNTLSRFCIEMYYFDAQLALRDDNNRRLFLRAEFDERGYHRSLKAYCFQHKKTALVALPPIIDFENKAGDLSLSKDLFATYVLEGTPPFDGIDFRPFAIVFDMLRAIAKHDSGETSISSGESE